MATMIEELEERRQPRAFAFGSATRRQHALADVPMQKPRIPVVSNVDARPHDDPSEIRELLIRQVCSQVRWEDSIRYLMEERGITNFYELGPGLVARTFMGAVHNFVIFELLFQAGQELPMPEGSFLRGLVELLFRGIENRSGGRS